MLGGILIIGNDMKNNNIEQAHLVATIMLLYFAIDDHLNHSRGLNLLQVILISLSANLTLYLLHKLIIAIKRRKNDKLK